MTNAYSFILFGILILQFFISLFLLVSFDCDTYFAAAQRISIKVHAEFEKLKSASKHEPRREQHDGLEETSESPL